MQIIAEARAWNRWMSSGAKIVGLEPLGLGPDTVGAYDTDNY